MKTRGLMTVTLSLGLFTGNAAAADVGVTGKWDSDRQATGDFGGVNCLNFNAAQGARTVLPQAGIAPQRGPGIGPTLPGLPPTGFGQLPRPAPPQSQFSIEIKAGPAGKLSGSVTVRSLKQGASVCIPQLASNKSTIEEGSAGADGKTFTFRLPEDINGVSVVSVWHGELLYHDTLRVRRETTSKAPLDAEVLFHRPGPHPKITVEGAVTIEGGGPVPQIQMTFLNMTPLRLPTAGMPTNRLAGLVGAASMPTATVEGSKFSVDLPVSEYRVGTSGIPSGFTVKAIATDRTDLIADTLQIEPETRKVRVLLTLGVKSPPPWNKVSGRVGIRGASGVRLKGAALAQELTAPIAKDGAFEFAQVLPGAYTLTVTPSNVVGNVSRTITVDSQAVAGIEILPPSAKDKVGEFVRIQPGEFNMGCLPEDGCDQVPLLGRGGFGPVALRNLKPPSQQRIEKAFELGKFEVTQAQWEQVMGKNPVAAPQPAARGARGGTTASIGPDHPVERVRWDEAHKFIDKLNKLNDGYRYRLPTAAEWEYAARAGGVAKTENSRINLSDLLLPGPVNAAGPANAWHAGNSGGASHRVGQLPANAWGLHDMLGNVAEWVEQSTERQTQKLTRGGSFSHPPELVSPATETPQHTNGSPLVGFRLAREPIVKSSSTRSKK